MDSQRNALLNGCTIPPHGDLPEFYASPATRAQFVSKLFDDTARYYDGISSAISFGTCKHYRKLALRRAGLVPGMRMLDVATGTGLVAQAALTLGIPRTDIVGLDPSAGMLRENQKRHAIPLVQGRGEALPFPDGSFDFVCMGYALRHVEDLTVLFREFHRVLRPGGRILILEITRPESCFGFAMGRFYLGQVLPLFVRRLTGNREAGRLLKFYWATIAECVSPETILGALASAGLADVARRKSYGMLSDYSAIKGVASAPSC
jgi:demethylmenaquinone methyltransferase/2-methoxy-6-polyprenyl-1,4-benzoquinol methylase